MEKMKLDPEIRIGGKFCTDYDGSKQKGGNAKAKPMPKLHEVVSQYICESKVQWRDIVLKAQTI